MTELQNITVLAVGYYMAGRAGFLWYQLARGTVYFCNSQTCPHIRRALYSLALEAVAHTWAAIMLISAYQ